MSTAVQRCSHPGIGREVPNIRARDCKEGGTRRLSLAISSSGGSSIGAPEVLASPGLTQVFSLYFSLLL